MVGAERPISHRDPLGFQGDVPGDWGAEVHDPVMLGPAVKPVAVALRIIGRRRRQSTIWYSYMFRFASIGRIEHYSM